ncbi:MAG: Hint domain-containing protein [Rhodobacteraceae bacterium]|nr:Hint domain-containing protein [Paracoccaceae bacterium]MCF8515467.1 Hint domain-containing protein [Paracoccaceae bacterium]MCF8519712.1 Hint domain-containing protein [Paracoccaceae bacterium]
MPTPHADPLPGHACQVFLAESVYVIHGVNAGDGLSGPDEVCEGDIYALEDGAKPLRLVLSHGAGGQRIASGGQIGQAGQRVDLLARYTLIAPDGTKIDILLMRIEGGQSVALPLSPMSANADYTLVAVEDAPEPVRLADLLCVSFARGTMITLADGRQRPIENLVPGDKVLTRDHGPQPLRLLSKATLRAVGAFAPVVITTGTLGNSGDLIVSPHHRVFLYQRQRPAGLHTSELLVQAKHLVDDETVFQREGGFIDYFSLIFDHHEIIYAEGVPAESLMVNDATLSRLPREIADDVMARFPGLAQVQHFGTEASQTYLEEVGRHTLLPRRGGNDR